MRNPDPALYRQLCEPHPTHAAAEEATARFFDLVGAARKECRIADVVVLPVVRYLAEGGEEVEGGSVLSYGDERNRLPIIATALGAERQRDREAIDRMAMPSGRRRRDEP